MPGKPVTVASYAAGASLAAVALIYVFGPTFTLDTENAGGSSRKKTVVGLRNQANDCFINSVLQVLAGLPELRIYLIRETHRRRIEDPTVYARLIQPDGSKELPAWKLQGLQEGLVTQGLKEILDALNERPIYKKSISPFQFVRVLETAFRQRISRQQQDAQELLQIVAERLKDEYHAGKRARQHTRRHGLAIVGNGNLNGNRSGDESAVEETSANGDGADTATPDVIVNGVSESESARSITGAPAPDTTRIGMRNAPLPEELDSFPMEGKYESQLQCLTCRYRTTPREETFCTLTLAVPQVSSTSLNDCFDGIFKTEHIDDFKCENCRLLQARRNLELDLSKSTSEAFKARAKVGIEKLTFAIDTNPEHPPEDVDLGDIRYAPKRKIAKTTRLTIFPKILAIHLSRSIYGGQMTQKNSAKVSFPEQLPLGGLADQRKYKLLGVVTHRGGHNSGHYEAFRRQNFLLPFSNTNTFQPSEAYSKTPTPISTPEISARRMASPAVSTPDLLSVSSGDSVSTPSLESMAAPPRSVPSGIKTPQTPPSIAKEKERDPETGSLRSVAASTKSALSRLTSPKSGQDGTLSPRPFTPPTADLKSGPKRRKAEKWWRISDEKVRESKTSEVLGMQKEVYLLFYELDKDA
jgi:ubiquitin carboxyl-terminal hydrolase 16